MIYKCELQCEGKMGRVHGTVNRTFEKKKCPLEGEVVVIEEKSVQAIVEISFVRKFRGVEKEREREDGLTK